MSLKTLLVAIPVLVALVGHEANGQDCRPSDAPPNCKGCSCGGGPGPGPGPGPDGPAGGGGPPGGGGTGPGAGPSINKGPPRRKPGMSGDPVMMANRVTYHTSEDFTIHTSLGPVEFKRYFVSDPKTWSTWSAQESNTLDYVPKPFGGGGGGPYQNGLRWWHSFFSLVHPLNDTSTTSSYAWVREMGGAQAEFRTMAPASYPYWCPIADESPSERSRLSRTSANAYEFYDDDGTTLVYDKLFMTGFTNRYYFLGKKKLPSGSVLFDITYGEPRDLNGDPLSGCTDAHATDGGPNDGVPYVSTVNLTPHGGTDGGNDSGKLKFVYGVKGKRSDAGSDCVVSSIQFVPSGSGSALTVARYDYNQDLSGDISLFSDNDAGRESYEYDYNVDAGRFEVKRAGFTVTSHGLTGAGIVASTSGDGPQATFSDTSGTENCGEVPNTCCHTGTKQTTMTWSSANRGDGTTATVSHSAKTNFSWGSKLFTHDGFVFLQEDTYSDALAGSPGKAKWYLTTLDGGASGTYLSANFCDGTNGARPGVIWAKEDKRGSFVVTPQRRVTPSGIPAALELTKTIVGASSRSGADGLESEDYTHSYGGWGQQRTDDVSKPSSINGNTTMTRTIFDGTTSRVAAVVTRGETVLLDGGSETRYRATFYKTARACVTPTTADPLARTSREEGPCWVSNFDAGSCGTGRFPVTEYEYYDPGQGVKSGQVAKVHVFPENVYPSNDSSSCGSPLTTEYVDYNWSGQPTIVRDPNYASNSNARTEYTYQNDRVATRKTFTSAGVARTTTWNYEFGVLTWVQYPNGNYEIYCYKDGTGNACTGAWTRSLQWKAKASNLTGSWTEKIAYEYNPDLSLAREAHYTYGDATRRYEKRYDSDADYRPTWEEEGSATNLKTRRRFDAANNLVALGKPFNGAPNFCDDNSSNSALCVWMKWDRASRLAQVDWNPSGSVDATSTRTCLDYNNHGDVVRVAAGCGTGNCAINHSDGGIETCSAAPVDYEVDDFGNTTKVTIPWTGDTSARGYTRYEYDALGKVVKKQTAEMAAQGTPVRLEYTYDSIGRLTKSTREGGTQVLLFELRYDSDAVAGSCPPLSNTKGRLSLRTDSFGRTYYSYDEEGRVTQEVRVRGAAASCGALHDYTSPHTTYGYDLNGNLTSIRYPRGRTVTYLYASGTDRVSSIQRDTYDATSGWLAQGTVIQGVAWEPYGGLRAYYITPTDQWVEYYRGGSLQDEPSYSSCDALPATYSSYDGSGRLRGVFVSDNTASLGSPNGLIFKQVYRWSADMLINQYTCHRLIDGDSTVVRDEFTYDKTMQLLTEATSASGTGESFTYDKRGNRTLSALTGPTSQITNTPKSSNGGAAYQLDVLDSVAWDGGSYNYAYDKDGRRTQMADDSNSYTVAHNYAQADAGAGLDSVYSSATIAGGNYVAGFYGYVYDAFGRRRAKTTPWSSTDESFHDLGHQLLSDQGGNTLGSTPTQYPEDDYIWLGGRPVVIIRSRFNTSWVRQTETWEECDRNAVASVCGTHFPVTDYLGKPVVMLATNGVTGGTAGIGRYEGFGAANRREARYASAHYAASSGTVMSVNEDMPAGFDGMARVLLKKVSYRDRDASMSFNGTAQSFGSGTPPTTYAHVWTPPSYRSSTGWALAWNAANSNPYGLDVEAYEVQMKQQWVWWFWTSLRLPGQYYDEETELHENWNRYYDPRIGRYLTPEPLMDRPEFALSNARKGLHTLSYGYALNNPVFYSDPTGLAPSNQWSCADLLEYIKNMNRQLEDKKNNLVANKKTLPICKDPPGANWEDQVGHLAILVKMTLQRNLAMILYDAKGCGGPPPTDFPFPYGLPFPALPPVPFAIP